MLGCEVKIIKVIIKSKFKTEKGRDSSLMLRMTGIN
jgi:hypothetical protein